MPVRQNLKFDVPGILDELLQIHLIVSEAGPGLRPGCLIGCWKFGGALAVADAPAAAPGAGLQQHWVTDSLRCGLRRSQIPDHPFRAGRHRHTGRAHDVPRRRLGPGLADAVPGGADERHASRGAGVRKVGIL